MQPPVADAVRHLAQDRVGHPASVLGGRNPSGNDQLRAGTSGESPGRPKRKHQSLRVHGKSSSSVCRAPSTRRRRRVAASPRFCTVRVPPRRGGTDGGGRERLVGMAAYGSGSTNTAKNPRTLGVSARTRRVRARFHPRGTAAHGWSHCHRGLRGPGGGRAVQVTPEQNARRCDNQPPNRPRPPDPPLLRADQDRDRPERTMKELPPVLPSISPPTVSTRLTGNPLAARIDRSASRRADTEYCDGTGTDPLGSPVASRCARPVFAPSARR